MDGNEVGQLLLQDIQNNLAVLQTVGLLASVVIATVGAVLAARAGAMLGEARHLYWRMRDAEKAISQKSGSRGIASAQSNATTVQRKRPPRRNKTVI
ncbi:MAG: hypothetical protein AAGB02_07105 [Pseudomonadota bacterium]